MLKTKDGEQGQKKKIIVICLRSQPMKIEKKTVRIILHYMVSRPYVDSQICRRLTFMFGKKQDKLDLSLVNGTRSIESVCP